MSTNYTVYFDANATTLSPPVVVDTVVNWVNRGNPSASYASAKKAQSLMQDFRRYISGVCGFELGEPGRRKGPANPYTVVFTSGASESNSHILTSAARSYFRKFGRPSHIVTSEVEHKSVLSCCEQLEKDGLATVTYLPVVTDPASPEYGSVAPSSLQEAITRFTCLVSIMAANNETGIVNDVRELGAVAHRNGVPFHTDCVQMFGKKPVSPVSDNVDAFSVSFHKLHGPAGVGMLVLRDSFVRGFGLGAMVSGTQNYGLRGGTENLPGIAGAFEAMRYTMDHREEKNKRMLAMKIAIMRSLSKRFATMFIQDYVAGTPPGGKRASDGPAAETKIVWISQKDLRGVLPNTLLLSVVRRRFCNSLARDELARRKIIVSIGSACNTRSPKASHVLYALGVPAEIRRGALRISMPDNTEVAAVTRFVSDFSEVIASDKCLEGAKNRQHVD